MHAFSRTELVLGELDSTRFQVGDIFETSVDPLAKVLRKELRIRGITDLKVVYSTEVPQQTQDGYRETNVSKRVIPGSVSFVPPVVGLILAGEVIKDIVKGVK